MKIKQEAHAKRICTMDVPYRCPRCGDGKTFHVLSDLKQHLSKDHSYVPTPRKRVQVFNGSKVHNSGRYSPLHQSFRDEGMRLERELQEAKDLEMNNKVKRYGENGQNSLDRSDLVRSVNAEFVKPSIISFQDDHMKNTLNKLTQEVGLNRRNQWKATDALIQADEVLSNVEKAAESRCSEQRSVIAKLSKELKGKEDDLKNSEQELDRLRKEQSQLIESAEILSRKTNEESVRLSEELEAKEIQLSRINSQLAHLRQNSLEDWAVQQGPSWKSEKDAKNMMMERNLMKKREAVLKRQAMRDDSFDHVEAKRFHGLQHEGREIPFRSHGDRSLSFEQTEQDVEDLDLLSQELRKMQRDAVRKMQEKDKELIRAKKRSEKLEKDRLVLLHEMENLLSKANSDNEKLKSELKNKDEELKEFNTNLEDAKKEQSKLVGETFELYREADKNIAKLKEMLTLKDFQVKAANENLDQFRIANEQLLAESESIAQHADEKGNIMETMLQTTEQSLQMMEKELNETKCEKEKLKEEAENLKQEVAERSRSLAELQEEVLVKERELEKTNDDLKTLQTFLQTTAAKESVARKELEKFIMELIERADKAEKELRTLKRHVRAASLAKESDESKSVPSTHIPVSLHNTLTEPIIHTTPSHQASARQGEDGGRRPTEYTTSTTASAEDRIRSRKKHALSDARNTSGLSSKPESHVRRSQEEEVTLSQRTESGYGKTSSEHAQRGVAGFAQTEGSPVADAPASKNEITNFLERTDDIGVHHIAVPADHVKPCVGTSVEGPEEGAHSRMIIDSVVGDQMSVKSSQSIQTESAARSSSDADLLVKDLKAVSDMAIQTDTPQIFESHLMSPSQSANPVNLSSDKELSVKQDQYICSKCSKVKRKGHDASSCSELEALPVPIYSSTPKKPTKCKKSKTICKHCHNMTSVEADTDDSDLEAGLKHSKEKDLQSARAAVLARIMEDEARMSNQLPREERLWHGLEPVPRLTQQASSYPRTDFQSQLRGRDVSSGFSRQFDRIRNPRTMQYAYSDSPSQSVSMRRQEINAREQRTTLGNPGRFDLRTRNHALETSPGYTGERRSPQSWYKEKSHNETLSDRIDKLEKVFADNRSKSNERLEKVLSEVVADSSRISTKQEIQKLRESIKSRLNPDRTKKKPYEMSASGASGTLPIGHRDPPKRLAETATLYMSPQSSDSYIGLPSSTDRQNNLPAKESTSQSYSTYRSSEPGLIIRNEFYGTPVHGGPQPRPEMLSGSKGLPLRQHLTNTEYPRANHQPQIVQRKQVEQAYAEPNLMPHYSHNQYYEHFPRRTFPKDFPAYVPYQHYNPSDLLLQRSPAYTPHRQTDRLIENQVVQQFEPGYPLRRPNRNRYEEFPKKIGRAFDSPNVSTDSDVSVGLELSVDENGILWDEEQADTTGLSEDLDSFRLSPSGSETAGDVDSSLLLSGSGSQPPPGKTDNHRQKLEEIAETDEESSYCGLPGDRSDKGQGHVKNGRGDTSGRNEGHQLRTDKGGMVSDIVSVRDKMMKYLDEGDLNGRRPHTAESKRSDTKRNSGISKDNDKDELNNSSSMASMSQQQRNAPLAEISPDLIHNRLESSKGSNFTYSLDSEDQSSSSYAPIQPSGSKSRLKRSDTFDLDVDNLAVTEPVNTAEQKVLKSQGEKPYSKNVGDIMKREVVEEPIQQQSKTLDNSSFEFARKLKMMSSSSESLDQSPRRRPVAKKRGVKGHKTIDSLTGLKLTGTDEADGNIEDKTPSQTVVKGDAHALEPSIVTGSKKSFESFDNRDSVLGTSIGSDPVDDMARHEYAAGTDLKKGALRGKEESGLTSSLDSLDDLAKYDSVPLKKAQPLRPSFADEATTDDEKSREKLYGNQDGSAGVYREESTDFDFESDLERFSKPLVVSKSSHKGKHKRNKVLTHKKARRGSSGRRLSIPKLHLDESSDAASDVSKTNKRHEVARRRRVALFCVFRYLDTRTLSQMALVCREWRHVCRHPELWKRVELKNERVSSSFLVTISQWCSRLQYLTLEGLQGRQRRSDENLDEYHQNTRACLEPGLEELLKCCQDSLISLQIIACGHLLTNKCLWLASCYGRLLETLHFVSSTDPVSAEVLWAIGGGCPGVTTLVIPPLFPCLKPKSFNNKCLVLIAKFYPDLQSLGIGGQEISIGGLLPLVQGCQRLQYLELDNMSEMTSDDVTALCRAGLRQLSVLELNATPITPDAVKQIYKSCRHLKRVRILVNFHDYFEDATKKKNIEEYQEKIQKLQDLLKQPGLGSVLKINAAPAE